MERVPEPTHDDAGRRAAVSAHLPISAEAAWALVTDVRNHARWVPLTRINSAPDLAVGDAFAAVSGPGASRGWLGLPDRMVVEHLAPPETATGTPGEARYRKLGPVLLGTASVRVKPEGPTSCTLTWTEDVHLRGLPRRLTAPLLRPVLALMLRVAMRRVRSELGN